MYDPSSGSPSATRGPAGATLGAGGVSGGSADRLEVGEGGARGGDGDREGFPRDQRGGLVAQVERDEPGPVEEAGGLVIDRACDDLAAVRVDLGGHRAEVGRRHGQDLGRRDRVAQVDHQ